MRHNGIYILSHLTLALTFAPMLTSCVLEDEPDTPSEQPSVGVDAGRTIHITTAMVPDRWDKVLPGEQPFVILMWEEKSLSQLETEGSTGWSNPYLYRESPQSVSFYEEFVYNLDEPYPALANQMLYATGFSPSTALKPSDNYRVLDYGQPEWSDEPLKAPERNDFICLDLWPDVFRGSAVDPFAQEKNRLYFRHLTSKLIFYVDRDEVTMENRQFVRHVTIKNLCMSIGDNAEWEPLSAPVQFTWGKLNADINFSDAYNKTIADVKRIPGNTEVTSVPSFGYKTTASDTFAGPDNPTFRLLRRLPDGTPASDRVPVTGMALDSCYVVSPIGADGKPRRGIHRLRMDISAELSFDFPFPLPDGTEITDSNTDDMTFNATWKNVPVTVYGVDANGNVKLDAAGNPEPVDLLKPGFEYRVYIHFSRTGVNLVARELPWNYGGIHYIAIIGGDTRQSGGTSGDTPAQ